MREEHYIPTQAAEFYLRCLPYAPMEPNIYGCLASSTKEVVSFPLLASSLSSFRPPGMEGGRVTIVDKIDVTDSRSIIYALFQWSPPSEEFFLVRVDCRLEGEEWRIELPHSAEAFYPVDIILEGEELNEKAFIEVRGRIAAERAAILKDIQKRKREEEMRAAIKAREDSLTDLIILGKGCYNNGLYRKAMVAFSKVLRLDPENGLAREYMAKCREALKKE